MSPCELRKSEPYVPSELPVPFGPFDPFDPFYPERRRPIPKRPFETNQASRR